jgi:RNA polymerase sigma-70 factor (ECF subfamily)
MLLPLATGAGGLTQNQASAARSTSGLEAEPGLASLYLAYAERVRRHLSSFGVRSADLDDLCQEVFLVVTDKRSGLAQVERMDLWLREISRKVAAGYRRRGFRQREVAEEAGVHAVEESAPLQSALLESQQDAVRLHHALHALDDESKDLIALHELGGLPLVDVAALVERDRKTVRKRLAEANRRLGRLFRDHDPTRDSAAANEHSLPEPAPVARVAGSSLQVLGSTVDIAIGLLGAVLIAVFRGGPTLEALELLDEQMNLAVSVSGSGLVYLAIVESSSGTPSLAARKKISEMLKVHAKNFGVYPHVLLGGFSWIARPIMAGLALLSGVPMMPFFGSVERAAAWLGSGYLRASPISSADLLAALEALRLVPVAPRASHISGD